ncbi:sugar phosphate isomerase/epimerase [Gracilibacillus boraciitolerans JCM 21714]|uniref:Sugar phosphate isomerase/epimerase n=1 Tax=Gracilibacillus boraciitolerans JCM 21714 TaxID=1298598 RepID=W4VEX6_9BACI|nr:sugar phosphate isomerase/epimerase [Gracilibacillus boraciitolerans]GAE91925.1 sugar phosphate isomerase/epimerase [Gracilibacillus boraciitolerans JCM 21714]
MGGKIAIQLYSVREHTNKDFLGTLSKLGEMGYEAVQFAGFFDTAAEKLKQVMDESGLVAAGSHMPFDSLTGDQLNVSLAYNRAIGNDLIICPMLPEEYRQDEGGYYRAAEELNEIGRKCKENGFTFAYHNHNMEFFDLGNGKRGFDIIFEETDREYVKMELDCYWATHAGVDPLQTIQAYNDLVVSLHIKDMKIENDVKRSIEIGKGMLDIKALWETGESVGVNWYIIEQEQFDGDPLDSAKENVVNLRKLIQN